MVLTTEEQFFMNEVIIELVKSRQKFPDPAGVMAALTEETGEVARAMLSETDARVYAECVQVAATALRIAIEGDPTFRVIRDSFIKPPSNTPEDKKEEFFKNKNIDNHL